MVYLLTYIHGQGSISAHQMVYPAGPPKYIHGQGSIPAHQMVYPAGLPTYIHGQGSVLAHGMVYPAGPLAYIHGQGSVLAHQMVYLAWLASLCGVGWLDGIPQGLAEIYTWEYLSPVSQPSWLISKKLY